MSKFDWSKVTENKEVISLILEIRKIEKKIISIDRMALVNYELERLECEDANGAENNADPALNLHGVINSFCHICGGENGQHTYDCTCHPAGVKPIWKNDL